MLALRLRNTILWLKVPNYYYGGYYLGLCRGYAGIMERTMEPYTLT